MSKAPEGTIWLCPACGKTTYDKDSVGANGWETSCRTHAVLCHDDPENVPGNGQIWVPVFEPTEKITIQ